jgi:hypothetical protein
MGEGPEETLKEIEETREALGNKIDALTGRIGEATGEAKGRLVKFVSIAGAAIGGILLLKKFRRRRG